jgi:hypothetical protein
MMQDRNGPDSGCPVPGTWNLAPGTGDLKGRPGSGGIPGSFRKTRPWRYANPVCAFSGSQTRSSVLGVRPSAPIRLRCRVPGPRCQIAGTRHLVPDTCPRKTRTRGMRDSADVCGPFRAAFRSAPEAGDALFHPSVGLADLLWGTAAGLGAAGRGESAVCRHRRQHPAGDGGHPPGDGPVSP